MLAKRRSGGRQITRAKIESDFTTTSTVGEDVTGLSITVPGGIGPFELEVYASSIRNTAASGVIFFSLQEGATILCSQQKNCSAANEHDVGLLKAEVNPGPGNHTYKVTVAVNGNSGVIKAAPTGPAYIKATRC